MARPERGVDVPDRKRVTDLGDGLVRALRTVTTKPEALWISTCLTAALLTVVVFGTVSSGKNQEEAQPN
jgi:hypothetical protein